MAYTTIDKPTDYFETVIYTGNGGTQSITSLDFAPNWVWIKSRSTVRNNVLNDTVRGATKNLFSNTTGAEATDTETLTSFNSDGFTLGDSAKVNENGTTFASWNWKAGTSFTNDASATGIGSIDSTGSVNQDAGFSICSYTGTGSAGTIKHGLNSTPSAIILKNRIDGSVFWYVYHKSLGNNSEMYLNATDAAPGSTGAWNTTSPTSSVFSVGSHGGTNASGQAIIAYCFAEKQGYSKFGSYSANNSSNGTYIHLGFKPALFICKKSSGTETWHIHDNKRSPFNVSSAELYASENQAEDTNARLDLLSNGVKMRTDGGGYNTGSETYIYMAFAESPFVSSTGVPATAR